jgi:F-type H+-transporting ATPase subunit a
MEKHFSWFDLLPGFENGDSPLFQYVGYGWSSMSQGSGVIESSDSLKAAAPLVPASWLVFFFITIVALFARRGLSQARAQGGTLQYVPDDKLGARNIMEMLIDGLLNQFEAVLGSRKLAINVLPLMGTLFIFILCCNLLSVLPGFLPPTMDTSLNWAMALVVFFFFNIAGFRANGMGYLKHMMGPMLAIAPLIFLLELIGVLFRPFSLQLRLMANLSGDHMVLGIFSDMIPLIIPCVFLGLGIFVSVVQAFVFTLLSTVYFGLAVAHPEEDH